MAEPSPALNAFTTPPMRIPKVITRVGSQLITENNTLVRSSEHGRPAEEWYYGTYPDDNMRVIIADILRVQHPLLKQTKELRYLIRSLVMRALDEIGLGSSVRHCKMTMAGDIFLSVTDDAIPALLQASFLEVTVEKKPTLFPLALTTLPGAVDHRRFQLEAIGALEGCIFESDLRQRGYRIYEMVRRQDSMTVWLGAQSQRHAAALPREAFIGKYRVQYVHGFADRCATCGEFGHHTEDHQFIQGKREKVQSNKKKREGVMQAYKPLLEEAMRSLDAGTERLEVEEGKNGEEEASKHT